MGVRAIDVSMYQRDIDWHRVKGDGVRGAWIKIGGADLSRMYKDPRADQYIRDARAVSMPYGTYYFCDTRKSPEEQANHAVDIGHGSGILWPAADLENNPGGLSQWNLDDFLARFCDRVRERTRRHSIWYGNKNVGVGFTTRAPKCPAWIANYGPNRPGTTPPYLTDPGTSVNGQPRMVPMYPEWDIWQFNSVTMVPGIPGNTVDQNVVTDEFWAAMTGHAGWPLPPSAEDEDDDVRKLAWAPASSKWVTEVAGLPPVPVSTYCFVIDGHFIRFLKNTHQYNDERQALIASGHPDREYRDVPDETFEKYVFLSSNKLPA